MKYIACIGLLFMIGCSKNATTPTYNTQPVIEAYLQAGSIIKIKVTAQSSSSETTGGIAIDTLNIVIIDNKDSYRLQSMGNGYYTDSTLVIREGAKYSMQFTYNGKVIEATTVVPSKAANFTQSATSMELTKIDSTSLPDMGTFTMPDPIDLKWDNPDNSYYMIVVQNIETDPELIRDTSDDRFPSRVFRNEPSVINEYKINQGQLLYFGRHILLLYHLNPDYATLYAADDNSSQNLKNPSTNISNGFGIFTGISADTLYLDVIKK